MEKKDKKNTGIDILSVDVKTMKEILIKNIEQIDKEDIVDFNIVWTKPENSTTFKKFVTIDIEKGGKS